MSITITITGNSAAEAAQLVLDLSAIVSSGSVKLPQETSVSTVAEKPKKPKKPPVVEEEEVDVPDEDMADEEVPTDVELRAAAQKLAKAPGGKAKVKALLDKYDVPNVTGVPDDQRVAFLKDLENA